MQSTLYALGAIALWATLASLGLALRHVPPFLLTGIALLIGCTLALPFVLREPAQWRIPARTLLLGVYGLFGFHFLLFIALRHAPPVEANLVNYLWPLFMVVLAPLLLPGIRLRKVHVAAALMGFTGAAVAILGAGTSGGGNGESWGYALALFGFDQIFGDELGRRRRTCSPTAALAHTLQRRVRGAPAKGECQGQTTTRGPEGERGSVHEISHQHCQLFQTLQNLSLLPQG